MTGWISEEDWKTIVANVPIVSVDLVVQYRGGLLFGKRTNPRKAIGFFLGGEFTRVKLVVKPFIGLLKMNSTSQLRSLSHSGRSNISTMRPILREPTQNTISRTDTWWTSLMVNRGGTTNTKSLTFSNQYRNHSMRISEHISMPQSV